MDSRSFIRINKLTISVIENFSRDRSSIDWPDYLRNQTIMFGRDSAELKLADFRPGEESSLCSVLQGEHPAPTGHDIDDEIRVLPRLVL